MDSTTRGGGRGWRLALGAVTLVLTLVTAFWPDWIEEVFKVDPDGGDGVLEIGIVLVLALVSVVCLASEWVARRRVTD